MAPTIAGSDLSSAPAMQGTPQRDFLSLLDGYGFPDQPLLGAPEILFRDQGRVQPFGELLFSALMFWDRDKPGIDGIGEYPANSTIPALLIPVFLGHVADLLQVSAVQILFENESHHPGFFLVYDQDRPVLFIPGILIAVRGHISMSAVHCCLYHTVLCSFTNVVEFAFGHHIFEGPNHECSRVGEIRVDRVGSSQHPDLPAVLELFYFQQRLRQVTGEPVMIKYDQIIDILIKFYEGLQGFEIGPVERVGTFSFVFEDSQQGELIRLAVLPDKPLLVIY